MSKGDFHTHSTNSDGVRSPTELIDHAYARGVRVMALTDHDTLDGLEEAEAAAARHPGFLLVPGVELSCDVPGTEVHILGYFIDRTNARLQEQLDTFRAGRIDRAQRIIGALERLGAPIAWERVQEIAGEASVGARTSRRHCSKRATSRRSTRRSTASSAATGRRTRSAPSWSRRRRSR